jgi:hypothetical protein
MLLAVVASRANSTSEPRGYSAAYQEFLTLWKDADRQSPSLSPPNSNTPSCSHFLLSSVCAWRTLRFSPMNLTCLISRITGQVTYQNFTYPVCALIRILQAKTDGRT